MARAIYPAGDTVGARGFVPSAPSGFVPPSGYVQVSPGIYRNVQTYNYTQPVFRQTGMGESGYVEQVPSTSSYSTGEYVVQDGKVVSYTEFMPKNVKGLGGYAWRDTFWYLSGEVPTRRVEYDSSGSVTKEITYSNYNRYYSNPTIVETDYRLGSSVQVEGRTQQNIRASADASSVGAQGVYLSPAGAPTPPSQQPIFGGFISSNTSREASIQRAQIAGQYAQTDRAVRDAFYAVPAGRRSGLPPKSAENELYSTLELSSYNKRLVEYKASGGLFADELLLGVDPSFVRLYDRARQREFDDAVSKGLIAPFTTITGQTAFTVMGATNDRPGRSTSTMDIPRPSVGLDTTRLLGQKTWLGLTTETALGVIGKIPEIAGSFAKGTAKLFYGPNQPEARLFNTSKPVIDIGQNKYLKTNIISDPDSLGAAKGYSAIAVAGLGGPIFGSIGSAALQLYYNRDAATAVIQNPNPDTVSTAILAGGLPILEVAGVGYNAALRVGKASVPYSSLSTSKGDLLTVKSIPEIVQRTEARRTGQTIEVYHATATSPPEVITARLNQARWYDDKLTIFASPEVQTYFLGINGASAPRIKIVPDILSNFRTPTLVEIPITGVKRLPYEVRSSPGFIKEIEYLQGQAGTTDAFIPIRSEARFSPESQGIGYIGTPELQVGVTGRIKRANIPDRYTVYNGRTVLIRRYEFDTSFKPNEGLATTFGTYTKGKPTEYYQISGYEPTIYPYSYALANKSSSTLTSGSISMTSQSYNKQAQSVYDIIGFSKPSRVPYAPSDINRISVTYGPPYVQSPPKTPYRIPVLSSIFSVPPYTPSGTYYTPPATPPGTPYTNIPVVPPISPPIGPKYFFDNRQPKKRKKAFVVQVRRRGKFLTIGDALPIGKALELGSRRTKETLAATFRLKEVGFTDSEDINYRLDPREFRQYEIKRKKAIPLPDLEFIQRRGRRLGSTAERAEIRLEKKRSKAAFGPLGF